jgi:peptidyl-prolyl cis-trans isomerase SurA
MRNKLPILFAVAALSVAPPSVAQQVQRIAAIVNDEVVSMFDLQARVQMVISTSGLKATPEVRRRLTPQVLRTLIDEQLRLQEAKRRNISVSKRNISAAISQIAEQNQMAAEEFERFLVAQKISRHTIVGKLRAEIAWAKLINRRLRPRITVGDEEVEDVIRRIKSLRGQTEYRISEIFLPIDSPEQAPEIRRSAERLVSQLRSGALFRVMARQFSQSASASVGGDLGWIQRGELDDDMDKIISTLKKGEISDAVAMPSGLRIVMLAGERRILTAKPADAVIALRRIFLPLPKNPPKEDVRSQLGLANILRETVSGCADMLRANQEVNPGTSAKLGKVKMGDLSTAVRNAISALPLGKVSAPVSSSEGVALFMVCQREKIKDGLPKREEIEEQIRRGRLGMMSRRYMRDLRVAAVVDMRV